MGLQRQMRRATGLLVAGTLSATLFAASGPRAKADEPIAPDQKTDGTRNPLVDIELAEAPLANALRFIEAQTGINLVVLRDPTYKYNNITLSLKAKPVDVVLRQVAVAAGADFWQEGGIYYVGPKGSKPQPPPDPIPSLPLIDKQEVRTKIRYEKIKLQYSEPHAILHMLGIDRGHAEATMLDLHNENVIHMLLNQQRAFQPSYTSGSGNIQSSFEISQGGRSTPPAAPGVPTGSGNGSGQFNINTRPGGAFSGGTGGGDQNNKRDAFDNFDGSTGGAFVERGGGQLGPPGGGLGGGLGQGGVGGGLGQGGQPGGLGQGGQQGGTAQNLLPPGVTPNALTALPADNSIIVNLDGVPNPELAYQELRDVIRLLDVKPRQINIRAEFVTITSNDTNGFGINWAFQKVNLIGGANTGFSTTNTAFLQYATGNLQTQLSWILTSGKGKLVAAPQASTLNNLGVQFAIQTQVPVFTSTPIVTPGGQTVIAQQIIPLPVTTGLVITPRINGDESITLFGSAFSSSVGAPTVGPNGESFPSITVQTAPVQRIIRNGDTIAIAGLTSKNDVVQTNKVPLLGDLPLIGNLFRSHNVTTADSELLVFITPTIIPERLSNATVGGAGGNLLAPGGGPAGPGIGGGGVNPGGP